MNNLILLPRIESILVNSSNRILDFFVFIHYLHITLILKIDMKVMLCIDIYEW